MSTAPGPVGTATWQADYVRTHLAEQSSYLATVASSSLMQQIAANTHLLLDLKPGDSVIEVGCGNGMFLPGLAEKVFPTGRVVGIDHSDAFVAEARARAASCQHGAVISVDLGDAYKLPFPTGSFAAAHCERVLMHLEDPTAAIREMARVVRPGGVVVAAEPDWAGIRYDHPDPEAFDLVYSRALRMRHTDIGLTLYRRFGEVALVERRFLPVTTVFTDFAALRMYGLQLEPAASELITEGILTPERLTAVVPALEHASANGTYYSIATMHVVAGTVPRQSETAMAAGKRPNHSFHRTASGGR